MVVFDIIFISSWVLFIWLSGSFFINWAFWKWTIVKSDNMKLIIHTWK